MKVIKAKVLGFCMGVRRAVDLAVEEARRSNGKPVYTFGPLIHNPKVLDDLYALGIQSIDESLLSAPGFRLPAHGSLIIRAHGISPVLEKKLRGNGTHGEVSGSCRIVDATCPKVKASQLKTSGLVKAGYFLFLAGEANHAEIEGLLGYAQTERKNSSFSNCVIAGNAQEARITAEKIYKENKNIKTALLGQTTISEDEYKNIGEEIKKFFPNLKIINTICAAASERRKALLEIINQADAVIIAGGEESANTRRLFAIAKESGKPCVLAENAAGIPEEFFAFETIGISAGASTPDSVIDEIERKLK